MLEKKLFQAAKDILEKNLKTWDEKKVLVYDLNSPLSKKLSKAYLENFDNLNNSESIEYKEENKEKIKEKLLSLNEWDTVILIQSTNFRLDNFRIRLNLHNAWIWCLEHNHLAYIKDDQHEIYADVISYKTPYFDKISAWLKEKSDKAQSMTFQCNDWSVLKIEWWFEDMKQNTWNYEWKRRWWTFPIWENFTEAKDFAKVNWELSIYCYPDPDLQIETCKPFKIKIKESFITCNDENCPENFRKILDKIENWEDWKVIMRELWFWLNPMLSRDRQLSDVNAFERIAGFHISLWMKHNIYRFKFPKEKVQRYHIDIFPDIKRIFIDGDLIFEDENYFFNE